MVDSCSVLFQSLANIHPGRVPTPPKPRKMLSTDPALCNVSSCRILRGKRKDTSPKERAHLTNKQENDDDGRRRRKAERQGQEFLLEGRLWLHCADDGGEDVFFHITNVDSDGRADRRPNSSSKSSRRTPACSIADDERLGVLINGREAALAPAHSRPLCFSNLSRTASYMTTFLLNQALPASVLSAQ